MRFRPHDDDGALSRSTSSSLPCLSLSLCLLLCLSLSIYLSIRSIRLSLSGSRRVSPPCDGAVLADGGNVPVRNETD